MAKNKIKYERYESGSQLISAILNVPNNMMEKKEELSELMKEEVKLRQKLSGKKLISDFNFGTINADYVNKTFSIRLIMTEDND